MQSHSMLFVLALLAVGAFATTTETEQGAVSWLVAHAHPQSDELADLKAENPMAYGIVKALLMKQSLGLLNARHPQASSFEHPPPQQDSEPTGAAAYAKFASPGELKKESPYPSATASTMMYPEVASQRMDNFNWKAKSSEDDDAAMVNQVLGAVASLKGKTLPQPASEDASPFANDEAVFGNTEQAAPVQAAPVAEAKPVATAPVEQGNSYLKGLNLMNNDDAPVTAPVKKVAHADAADAAAPMANELATFSFSDDAPAPKAAPVEAAPAEAAPVAPKEATPFANDAASGLSGFSFGDDAPPAPKPKPSLAATKPATKTQNALDKFLFR